MLTGPAQQPILAVGQDTHPHPALLFRLLQVIVQLPYVFRVRLPSGRRAYPALELHESIQGGEVNGAAGGIRGRVFLLNLIVLGQAGHNQEVTHGAGDVGFGLKVVVPPQDLGRCAGILGVVYIQVFCRNHRLNSVGIFPAMQRCQEGGKQKFCLDRVVGRVFSGC